LERPELGVFIEERASDELAEKLRDFTVSKAASFVEKERVTSANITGVTLWCTIGLGYRPRSTSREAAN
jgi:hypothetical protein